VLFSRESPHTLLGSTGKGLLPIATPSVPYAMFADVDDILRSPLVHSLIYTVLHHTATSAKSSKYSGTYSVTPDSPTAPLSAH
jgi:hypothetical protein